MYLVAGEKVEAEELMIVVGGKLKLDVVILLLVPGLYGNSI